MTEIQPQLVNYYYNSNALTLDCTSTSGEFVTIPMSEIAQNEARTKMITAVRNDSLNDQNFQLGKEMLTGIFVLTNENLKNITPIKIKSYQELIDIHPGTIVEYYYKNKLIKNTAGRIVFNLQLPDYIDFIDQDISNKELNKLFSFIVAKSHDDYAHTLDKLMKLGFRYATIYPRSISLDMFTIPPQLKSLAILINVFNKLFNKTSAYI